MRTTFDLRECRGSQSKLHISRGSYNQESTGLKRSDTREIFLSYFTCNHQNKYIAHQSRFNVSLGHELEVLDAVGVLPPLFPLVRVARRDADVADGRVEPHVEHLGRDAVDCISEKMINLMKSKMKEFCCKFRFLR